MKAKSEDELYQQLMTSSFRYLSVRLRSQKEMTDFLSKKAATKAIPTQVVSRVFTRLKELEYIDDRKFAQMVISSRIHGKPKGQRVIVQELKLKGVDPVIIEELLAQTPELTNLESLRELAVKALGKKLVRYCSLDQLECSRKVYDFVIRRGFSSQVASSLVDDYCKKAYNKD